ncbi:heavy metal translocating P-type ATPase [Microvirga thermotolerans]|uniref:P-type Zn(2+) transporter n=1 Tax=Microvirga thermotolerans TaxID=2651334 RepID=A0A5P9JPN5_9HYPH|nr:heavy metal translocating P-type ATPase [Microvirga thermotolerans]QFU14732.1 cadmium-translocating P-type ATPase [Microvirga thermotolerans]
MSDRLRYRVEGMDCGSCARKIETALTRVPGVSDISITTTTETLRLRVAEASTGEQVEKVVRDLGYGISPISEEARPPHANEVDDGPWWRSPKGRLTLFCGLALAAAWGLAALLPGYEAWLYTAAMAIGLVPIARRAASAALAGAPFTIEALMTIAAVGAVIIGETEEAAIVVLLFLVGELLEGVAAGRARASIRSLTSLVPKTAFIERNGTLEEVAAESLAVGDVIAVRPGDRVPADGVIVSGESAIDEAPVTGESTPKRKGEGETVFAGTINTDGTLRVRVTAEAQDNTIARVVRLVEEAQEAKAPTERFIDRFSRYYTPAVLVVGALVAILPPLLAGEPWGEWVYKGLAVLLIGCPCALVISTPAAIAAGLAAGARRGLLIKGGAVLEILGKVTAVALDKTGTLTEGKPKVTDVVALQGTEREVLEDAAALDATSSHPIAKAIVARAQAEGIEVAPAVGVMALGGKGVKGRFRRRGLYLGSPKAAADIAPLPAEAAARISALQEEGKTVSVLLVNDAPVGLIAVRDEPREDAMEGLKALKARGIMPIMLTGDNARTAAAIARSLGVEPRADLLPQDKLRIVNELKAQGQVVAKVGDGINDAPALAAADVGIAMGGGTDVALETADGAVLHGRVLDIGRMIALSKATMGNIRQNIVVALGLKAVFLVTTILGITGLWPAILADTGATVLVTANAMRLLRFRGNA